MTTQCLTSGSGGSSQASALRFVGKSKPKAPTFPFQKLFSNLQFATEWITQLDCIQCGSHEQQVKKNSPQQ
jgi:hypothetical protein